MVFFNTLKFKKFQGDWRRKNRHNDTRVVNMFERENVEIGRYTYGPLKILKYSKASKLIIGDFCSIAGDVTFIVDVEHPTHYLSTYPFKVKVLGQPFESLSKGEIVLEDDVWIGQGATILSGVRISQGAVVAAGAVVTKDVPPYAIVAGVPAKVINYRFGTETIDRLLKFDYSKLTDEVIEQHLELFYSKDVDKALSKLIEEVAE